MIRPLVFCNGRIDCYHSLDLIIRKIYGQTKPYTITVDGGITHARKCNIVPDLAIGDFDSISEKDHEYLQSMNIKKMAFPSDKDKTDTELSLDYLIEQGYTECVITAFTGTRYDHSCANLFMFAEKTNTINITMIDSHNIATFCTDSIRLDAKPDEYVSIIPLTKTITVEKTEGLAYKLQDYTLKRGMTLGVSNYPDKPEQKITLSHGKALITISHD